MTPRIEINRADAGKELSITTERKVGHSFNVMHTSCFLLCSVLLFTHILADHRANVRSSKSPPDSLHYISFSGKLPQQEAQQHMYMDPSRNSLED